MKNFKKLLLSSAFVMSTIANANVESVADAPKTKDSMNYQLFFGYESMNTQSMKFENVAKGREKVENNRYLSGFTFGPAVEFSFADGLLFTTSNLAFSYLTDQIGNPYFGIHESKEYGDTKYYALNLAQSFGVNVELNKSLIFQPLISGSVGYAKQRYSLFGEFKGKEEEALYRQSGFTYTGATGFNLKFNNGLMPFFRVGYRVNKFTRNSAEFSNKTLEDQHKDQMGKNNKTFNPNKVASADSMFYTAGLAYEF